MSDKKGTPRLITTIKDYDQRQFVNLSGPQAEREYEERLKHDAARWPKVPSWDHHALGIQVPELGREIDIKEFKTETGIILPHGRSE